MDWFTTEAGQHGWATCAVTELGVIGVCAQLLGGAWPPETTADRLLLLTAERLCVLARCCVARGHARSPQRKHGKPDYGWYLLGLARRHGGRVITFDRALAATGGNDVVCLLTVGG